MLFNLIKGSIGYHISQVSLDVLESKGSKVNKFQVFKTCISQIVSFYNIFEEQIKIFLLSID